MVLLHRRQSGVPLVSQPIQSEIFIVCGLSIYGTGLLVLKEAYHGLFGAQNRADKRPLLTLYNRNTASRLIGARKRFRSRPRDTS